MFANFTYPCQVGEKRNTAPLGFATFNLLQKGGLGQWEEPPEFPDVTKTMPNARMADVAAWEWGL